MRLFKQICVILIAATLVMACSQDNQQDVLSERMYNIYYLNTSGTGLISVTYSSSHTDLNPEELINQILNIPSDVEGKCAIPDKVEYMGYKKEDKALYLYFDTNYAEMKPEVEILCRATLAKTLTQIDGIDYIGIYAGEQSLLDTEGKAVGLISAEDFIDSITDINSFDQIELTLYFTDDIGEKLIEEKRSLVYDMNTSREKLIIEQLMKGSHIGGHMSTIPSGAKLISVSTSDNICYVNFDEGFLERIDNQQDYISIYSIVNSLSELSTVNKVQFLINGVTDIDYGDKINFNNLFERNLDYIKE